MASKPKTASVCENVFSALPGGLRLGEKLEHFFDGQFDGDGAHHFFFDPGGDVVHGALPFVDGGSAGVTKPSGELFACHAALLAKVAEDFWFHG